VISDLFGRNTELTQARTLLAQALAGQGGMLLLSGEPGIGKTRLADELANLGAAEGATVHWGRGWEGGGAPAYWAWTQALSSLTVGLDTPRLAALVERDGPELIRLLPDLLARFPALEPASLPNADEGRFRLACAVAATLKRAAAAQPLIIVLDDLHLADAATLSCLQLAARSARGLRLLLIGTYREAEARLSPLLAQNLGALSRDALTLTLSALSVEASLELVREGTHLSPETARAIIAATGGNPLFLNEMSRLVASRGAQHLPGSELPLVIQESIRQRLALLPAPARAVLDAASCAGSEIDPPLLSEILGLELNDVLAPLELAAQAGMVLQRAQGARVFSHQLFREVLYRGLPHERRLQFHQQLAAALSKPNRADRSTPSAVAHHLLEAAELSPEAAIRAAIDAARAALEVVAFEDALALLDRAQPVIRNQQLAPPLVAAFWLCVAEARIAAGQVIAAKEACTKAAAIARDLEDPELLANAALTWGSEIQPGKIDLELVAWLQQANAGLTGSTTLKARVLGRLAAALQPAPSPEVPAAMAMNAIAMARETGDDRTLLEVIHSAMAAMMEYVHPRERLPLNLEQEALAQRFHDRPRELRARLRLFFDYLVLGDVGLAQSRAISFAVLAQQLRQTRFAWFIPSWEAARATFEGRFSDVEGLLAEATRLSEPGVGEETRDFIQRTSLARAREDHTAIVALSRFGQRDWSGMELGPSLSQMVVTSNLARIGKIEEARLAFTQVSASARPSIGSQAIVLSESIAILDPGAAVTTYQTLLPLAGLQSQMGLIGMTWEGPIDRLLGLVATSLGRLDAAVEHFDAAIANLTRLNGRGFLARVWLEAAQARVRRNASGDRSIAETYVEAARALATELGQRDLLTQFDFRPSLETAPVPSPQKQPANARALSLRRAGDFWEVKGAGPSFRLKTSRGLALLSKLLERPDQEVHCLELASDGAPQEIDGGDAGEWLDSDARRQYQSRVDDLRETIREADQFGDGLRSSTAKAELDFIAAELSRGIGLGGRGRKAGSTVERARVAVQRRLKDAVTKIAEQDASLGRHLEWALKTGTYCCYRPSR
jgi:tetratricopeptide (TPR) repeat protein